MAINAKIDLKKPVLEEISAQVEGAQCVLLVNYSGLTVAQDTQLRKELREAGVHYKVYKNTMMKRAFAGTAFEPLTKDLDGTNAIAISKDDAPAPPKPLIMAQVLHLIQVFTLSPSIGQCLLLRGFPASKTAIFKSLFCFISS